MGLLDLDFECFSQFYPREGGGYLKNVSSLFCSLNFFRSIAYATS